MEQNKMSDQALDRLLHEASRPALPHGFETRLRAKLEQHPTAQVIAFPTKSVTPVRRANPWFIGVPLAASLLLGLSLGALGLGGGFVESEYAETENLAIGSGLEEAEEAAQLDT